MSSDSHFYMCISHKSQSPSYRLSVSVSVSADMKKILSVIYRYRPITKLDLSVAIGIGRYGKSHIDRTLSSDNLISLSYLMPVFSVNLFDLFVELTSIN